LLAKKQSEEENYRQRQAKNKQVAAHPILMPNEANDPRHWIPFDVWCENNFYTPDTVIQYGKQWDYSGAKLIELDPTQRDITNHVLSRDKDGFFKYSTIVYSTIKKEGKTTLAGAVGTWYGCNIDPPNLILTLANDQEQSAGRIFGAMTPTLNSLGCKVPMAVSSKPQVNLPNGTVIQAIANNYAGAAGANYGLTLWSELWAYTSERSRRLYDELVPVPTRRNSLRWIETYVGFEDESELLLSLFKRVFVDTEETAIQPAARPVPELMHITSEGKYCCWHIPEEGLFYYHNHTPRMPWNVGVQGDKFRAAQKADLRPSQYVRLWENRWQSSEGGFVDPQWVEDAVTLQNTAPTREPGIFALDGSVRNDTIFLVGTNKRVIKVFGEDQERYKLTYAKVWDPNIYGAKEDDLILGTKKGDINLEETVAKEILRLYELDLILGPVWYDPYQLHQVAVNLRKLGVPCVEFSQQGMRLSSDTFLGKLLKSGLLDLYRHHVLIQHIKNAKAKEYENEQVRIVKGTFTRGNKVDGAVALAMSVYKSSVFRPAPEDERSTSSN
jgi:hypothetical protein